MNFKNLFLIICLGLFHKANSQNLPSLVLEKNINSTFSIVAYDVHHEEWGIAVVTNNICVGSSTIYIEPMVGAFSVIAETEPKYAKEGLEQLKSGNSIMEAIQNTRMNDEESHFRQVSGIDAKGNVYAFTGEALKYWNGNASSQLGKDYVVIGNQLADEVLFEMAKAYENSKGTLAERLLKSIVAGQNAGGQISGKQSAAIQVKRAGGEWFNQIDLRVDNSKNPIEELQVLMDYHYGRIRLNQSAFALREGNAARAKQKLSEAEEMLEGWSGMYSRIAALNAAMNDDESAVKWIKKGLLEAENWSVYLPAFYFLRDKPDMKLIIKPDSFSINDWETAMGMLSNLGRELRAIDLGKELISKKIESSYLNFLLGRSYFYEKQEEKAIKHLEKALQMDNENIEAQRLLKSIND